MGTRVGRRLRRNYRNEVGAQSIWDLLSLAGCCAMVAAILVLCVTGGVL